ncbi:hypothetical protein ABGB12_26870 [Actinocorallia sp. B10E7]|uniref:hypothetical protein n=1 Tax=Actinocorallia sp. B10E7 TaxID=3153558 RepID=UPI00325CEFFA
MRLHIEHWPTGREEPKTQEVLFKFWPPLEADDADPWSCHCDKPTGETMDGPGHWEQRVQVEYYDPRVNSG